MEISSEEGVHVARVQEPKQIDTPKNCLQIEASECPTCRRLANLRRTGEWTCPRCGGPDMLTAIRLYQRYVSDPKGE